MDGTGAAAGRRRPRFRGRVGVAIAAFGLLDERAFVLGLVLLAISLGADTVSSIFRATILQLEVPDELRGRLNALNIMFVFGGPTLGQVESGVVAQVWSPEAAVVSGGLACLAVVGALALGGERPTSRDTAMG